MSGSPKWSRAAGRLSWAVSVVAALLLAPSCSRTKPSGEGSAAGSASAAPEPPAIGKREKRVLLPLVGISLVQPQSAQ